MSEIYWTEQVVINALHNLENPDLSDLENERLYGICFRKHGHDYKIQIELEAQMNEKTGLAVNREELQEILHQHLIAPFQASFLNHHFDCTSGEALSLYFFELLKAPIETKLKNTHLVALHIQETRKNWFSYSVL